MQKTTVEYDERWSKKWIPILLAFLLGGLIGWLISGGDGINSANSLGKNNSNNTQQIKSGEVPLGTALNDYTQMLVEASREGVDAPSDEANAAKQTLAAKTDVLAKSIAGSGLFEDTNKVKENLNKVNEGFLAYASTARSADNHQDLDKMLSDLGISIKNDAKNVKNQDELLSTLISFKNSVLESIRSFVNSDYQGSYDKQVQAQAEAARLFNQLQ